MPTYDYICEDCGHHLEAFHSMSSAPLTECPECNGSLKRQIGAGAGLLFKGSGFYQTDYRSDSYSKGASADNKRAPTVKNDAKKDQNSASKKVNKKAQ